MRKSKSATQSYSLAKLSIIGVGACLGLMLGIGELLYSRLPIILAKNQFLMAAVQTSAKPAKSGLGANRAKATDPFRQPDPIDFANHAGYVQIFNGHNLKGWDGDPSVWHVEDGAIVGQSTKAKPVDHSYISFHGFDVKDFDLKLEIKVENGGGSGIQYRSKTGLPWRHHRPGKPAYNLNWLMTGPQADFWYPVNPRAAVYTGQFYSENTGLGILAWRGQVVESSIGKRPRLDGNIGNRSALGGYVRVNGWNQYMIMARGGTFIHIINGQLMAVYLDNDSKSSNNQAGLIGIELESTPCKVSVRNVWVKRL